jgi:hypothetical protein
MPDNHLSNASNADMRDRVEAKLRAVLGLLHIPGQAAE